MDSDMNRYELEHVVTDHANMSRSEWQASYFNAWDQFYTLEHLETVLRRANASGINMRSLMVVLLWFSSAVPIEKLHPLQAGLFRRKVRTDRRRGLPIEPVWVFYPKYFTEIVVKTIGLLRRWRQLNAIVKRIETDTNASRYTDDAMRPVNDESIEDMALYTQTESARAAVMRERRVAGQSAAAS